MSGTGRSCRVAPCRNLLEDFVCYSEDEHVVENSELGVEIPPFGCAFSKAAGSTHILAIADEDGFVKLIDTNKMVEFSTIAEWSAHMNAVFDLAWNETEPKLLTASGDQTCVLWDTIHHTPITKFIGHQSSIKSINFRRNDANVFVSGSRDGNIMIWDTRCNRQASVASTLIIANAHVPLLQVAGGSKPSQNKRRRSGLTKQKSFGRGDHKSVTCVLFQHDHTVVSAGASDNEIKFWDIRKINVTGKEPTCWEKFPYAGRRQRQHGYSSLVLDSTCSRLFASCTDDVIYVYSCVNFSKEPLCSFHGHLNSTFYVRSALSADDRFLLSGSSDNHAYIWDVNSPDSPPYTLIGHTMEVSSVTWSPQDFTKLITCSDDCSVRVWRIDRNHDKHTDTPHHRVVGKCQLKDVSLINIESQSSVSSPTSVTSPNLISTKNSVNTSILKFMTGKHTHALKLDLIGEDKENESVLSNSLESDLQSVESGYGSLDTDEHPCKRVKDESSEYDDSVPAGCTNSSNKRLKLVTINQILQQQHKPGIGCHGKHLSPNLLSNPMRDEEGSHVTCDHVDTVSMQSSGSQKRTIFDYFAPKLD
ncbi:denticleless protein homolog isoform X2 [Corticium candelabrum]|uniref:denticleless protein homolog isoform X2 n=1 Tax=Corticium candelabrum TaxID=121492 RepID=UPI002E2772A3|nr:denticleless protein homolog isoform X2 [Corticium candelabrum]